MADPENKKSSYRYHLNVLRVHSLLTWPLTSLPPLLYLKVKSHSSCQILKTETNEKMISYKARQWFFYRAEFKEKILLHVKPNSNTVQPSHQNKWCTSFSPNHKYVKTLQVAQKMLTVPGSVTTNTAEKCPGVSLSYLVVPLLWMLERNLNMQSLDCPPRVLDANCPLKSTLFGCL